MHLTQQQIRFFRDTGYLKISEKVPTEDLERMRRVIVQHIDECIPPFKLDSSGSINRLDQVVTRDPVFKHVFCSPLILNPLESLLGPNIELVLNRHNHATVNSHGNTKFRLHRDILQWSRSVVTVIVFLDDADTDNGCTHLIPGSHFLPFIGTPNNGGTWMDEHSVYGDLLEQALPIPVSRGGVIMFDSLVFHTIGENRSDRTRMSVCMGFRSVNELSGVKNDPKCMLVLGDRIYRGNDKANGEY